MKIDRHKQKVVFLGKATCQAIEAEASGIRSGIHLYDPTIPNGMETVSFTFLRALQPKGN